MKTTKIKNAIVVLLILVLSMLSNSTISVWASESTAPQDQLKTAIVANVPVPTYVVIWKDQSYKVVALVKTIRVPANSKTPIGVKEYSVLALFDSTSPVIIPQEEYKKMPISKEIPDYREYDNKHPYRKNFQDFNNRWGSFVGQVIGLALTAVSSIRR